MAALGLNLTHYRLILVDLMKEEFTGLDFIRKLKRDPQKALIPVVLISSIDDDDVVVDALDAGADDYMAKPISSRELLARINSVLRRRRMMDSRRAANQVSFKGLVLDTASGQATIDGTPVSLSKAEFLILGMLLRNRGQFFERIEIKHETWDNVSDVSDRAVDTTISRLRKKLGDYGSQLVNRQGFGYGFVE
jgi:DNA-binding response OmpR family regulator